MAGIKRRPLFSIPSVLHTRGIHFIFYFYFFFQMVPATGFLNMAKDAKKLSISIHHIHNILLNSHVDVCVTVLTSDRMKEGEGGSGRLHRVRYGTMDHPSSTYISMRPIRYLFFFCGKVIVTRPYIETPISVSLCNWSGLAGTKDIFVQILLYMYIIFQLLAAVSKQANEPAQLSLLWSQSAFK